MAGGDVLFISKIRIGFTLGYIDLETRLVGNDYSW